MSTVDEANVSVPAMFLRRHAPFVGVFGCLFTFLKSNSEAPPHRHPMCVCYFLKICYVCLSLDVSVRVCVCVCGTSPRACLHGEVCSSTAGFCGVREQVRDEKKGVDKTPSLRSHINRTTSRHKPTHTEGGGNS